MSDVSLAIARMELPKCAVCLRPVDSIGHASSIYRGQRRILRIWANCHGRLDVLDLSYLEIARIVHSGGTLSLGGTAFGGPHPLEIQGPDGAAITVVR